MDFDPDNPTPPGGSEKEPPKDAPKAADKTGPAGLAPGVGSGLASGAASGVASLGGQFSTIVDLPRFRGLYRAME